MGGAALYLVAAAVGYWVLERAAGQKKGLKTAGQIVGAAIIIFAFLGFACKSYATAKYGKGGYFCPMTACPSGMNCPFMKQQPPMTK